MLIPGVSGKVGEAGKATLSGPKGKFSSSLSGVNSLRELEAVGCGGRFKYVCLLSRVETDASALPSSAAVLVFLRFDIGASENGEAWLDCLELVEILVPGLSQNVGVPKPSKFSGSESDPSGLDESMVLVYL